MINKKSISFLIIMLASAAFSLGLFYNFSPKKEMILYSKGDSYLKLWKKVDSCQNKGLTESALKIVEVIYDKAKAENNSAQFVKAVLNRMKFESYKEEFSLEKSIFKLRDEAKEAKYPIKPVLQSILADAFWQYFQNNRWKFYNRTTTVGFKNDDIETWDLKTITNAVIVNYKASLENVDSLKRTKIDIYDDVLNKGTRDCRSWRPTLYDFLAHRALSFFMNSEPDVSRPSSQFNVNNEDLAKPFSEFVKVKITNPSDSLELKYYALKLIQDLTLFHINDDKSDALIDLELLRLNYVHVNSQNPKKDTLYFSSLKFLQDKFSKNERVTEIDFKMASWYNNNAHEYKPLLNDNFKWYKKTAVEICEAAILKYPKSYGALECKNLIYTIQSKNYNLIIEEVNEPNKSFRALVTSQNINKVFYRIVKTNNQELRLLIRKKYGKELYEKFLSFPTAKTFTQNLVDDKDFQSHNTEIVLPDLENGYYVILSSLNEDFKYENNLSAYSTCIISDIASKERRKEDGSYDFYALNRQTGEPLANITAQLWYENYDYKARDYVIRKGATYKTDEKGFLNISSGSANERQFFIEFINGKDSYYNNNSYYTYKPYKDLQTRISSHIFTDRAIYRPGQAVYFKGIVLESTAGKNHKLKTNYPVTVTFYDVNYQKVGSLNLVTNEYGTVNGTFIAPQGGLNGQMSITDGYSSSYISVEDYKRPKFETQFNPVKGSYRINDEVTVSGFAKAYAGNFIDGAQVKYRVVRRVNYPYWYWWYRPYYSAASSEVEITNGEITTNDTGTYMIKFKALADESVSKKSYATYNYEISADVTDINGETHSTSCYVTVGYQALQLSVFGEEVIEQNNSKPIRITTTNLNGVAESTKGTFAVYRLKQPQKVFRSRLWTQPDRHILNKDEYYKKFPLDLYADETNKYKWEKDTKVIDKTFDTGTKTEYDLATEIKSLKAGNYKIEANCKDKFGEEIVAFCYITVFNKNGTEMPELLPEWYYIDKTTAEPGESVNFIYNSAYPNTNYLLEVERQGQLLSSKVQAASMKLNEIKVEEADRGNLVVQTSFIRNNRFYSNSQIIYVPYTNKELDIQFETFRNKLLPGQAEEWKLIIKDKKGEKVAAEMVASMYDASLDAFKPNYWNFNIFQSYYSTMQWTASTDKQVNSSELNNITRPYEYLPSRYYDRLNYYGLNFYNNRYYRGGYDDGDYVMSETTAMPSTAADEEGQNMPKKSAEKSKNSGKMDANSPKEESEDKAGGAKDNLSGLVTTRNAATGESKGVDKSGGEGLGEVKARSNFNETAFFFPELQTNEKGEIIIKFTVPESLTKWKVMGLAHTKDLKSGQFQKEVVTQKDLMVQPNAPRFFREGDKITFISKIANLSEKELSGMAELKLFDALTEQEISTKIIEAVSGPFPNIGSRTFTVKKGLSTSIEWNLNIPEGYSAIKYKVIAKAGNFSDGEEVAVPVLTNRMLVTESMPMPIRSNQTKEFNFTKFTNQNNKSTTLKNHAYTLEFTANPAWYAIQALPYLMEYPYECAEQTFSRYYANSLATYVVNSKPKIKSIFDAWKSSSPDAFLSNLEKNQELKAVVLEETPWVLQSKSESENKKRVGLLFDLNRMSHETNSALKKLMKKQSSNGGFMWFDGMPDDWYITQHITCGFGHLNNLGVVKVRDNSEVWSMLYKAVKYCDNRMREEYEYMKKYNPKYKTENHLSYNAIQYLYMRSFYKDIDRDKRNVEYFEYYKAQEQKYWLDNGRYMQGMIALSLNRFGDIKTPKDILKSLKENSINSEEMGMYWKENYGYYWYEAPIEMQALMIEAFDEINNDTKSVDDLKTWLIKSKQTQHWGTTRATTEAVYALLLKGTDWLATEPNVEITVGDIKLDPKNDKSLGAEPGTGYFKKTWSGSDIKPESMGKVKVVKKDVGVSYGAMYWQYFEQLDKITPHETPLKLKKQLFLQKNTASGIVIEPILASTKLKPGDKIKVRIELRVDRDMSYVHMKDMRAAGFEPTNVFSGYKYQDGLGYYESTRDAATNFFFSYLNKGTYVFEYPLVVNHYGDFSNGVTTIQCMYAPEFTSHSEGVRVKVEK
ncbi:MAG: alpha-2-macroglobulin family protein [Bacteroidota bacterium]|nr:alpha-2-macroglobulin family protein [Bacteroidota bacterium]MDP3144849.1 alpha-2-macroglobulin family protein [Bacteroidota bacterium]